MGKLSPIGRICYAIAIAGLGFMAIYYADFPYMLIPSPHTWIPVLAVYIAGALLIAAGTCIASKIKIHLVTLLLGSAMLLIFCCYYIPYELIISKNYMHFGEWENAAKELALAAGAFVVAGYSAVKDENAIRRLSTKLQPYGTIVFAITILSFGLDHFLYARQAADYVPSWIPGHLFWIYVGGIALTGAGIAIIINVKRSLSAFLLGAMIFTWFIILHIPKAIAAPAGDMGGETSSAFLALAYSGIAFVIAAHAKPVSNKM